MIMMNMYNIKPSRQTGLTLVELMVASVISLLLLAGVIQIFISNKTTYRVVDGISRVQENGRFGLEFLSKDVRMAGYKGCSASSPLTNTLKCPDGSVRPDNGICTGQNDLTSNFNVGLEGFNNIGATPPTYLTADGINPLPGTDVIIIRRNSEGGIRVVKNNNGAQVFVSVTSTLTDGCGTGVDMVSGICPSDILLISDCNKSRLFQAGNTTTTGAGGGTVASLNITHPASGTPGNSPTSWGGNNSPADERFGNDAEIAKIITNVYFIANGASGPALFRKSGPAEPAELIEGVKDMQVLYGEDMTNDTVRSATIYVTANNVTNWDNVISVRPSLLLSSIEDNITEAGRTFTYNGATQTATDRRLHKVFTSTFTVRNHLR